MRKNRERKSGREKAVTMTSPLRNFLALAVIAPALMLGVSAIGQDDVEKLGQSLQESVKDSMSGSRNSKVLNGSDQTITQDAGGKSYVVNGRHNRITLRGECPTLTVNGTDNEIQVEKVDEISVAGANNRIIYQTSIRDSKPATVRIFGAGSRVVKSEGESSQGAEAKSANEDPGGKGGRSQGGRVIISGNNLHASKRLDGNSSVFVQGNNNVIKVTGQAEALTITGNNNSIDIDGVTQVAFTGNNNLVKYSSGGTAPRISQLGTNNRATPR